MMVHEKPVVVSPCGQYIKTTTELGKGSQTIVYKGNDLHNGKCIAWCEPKSREKSEWEKFTKTSTLLENIRHKNIITFLDFWEASPNTSRTPVLVTELMSCTLKQHLETSPRGFDHSALRSWAHQVLDAIRYLHSNTHHVIVHRSIRCDHVLINTHTGDVKLSSFSNATVMERGRYLDDMIGEVAFMSPEMVNEHYTESTDIYSYGLYIMEISSLEYPYEECEKLSQTLQYLKTEKYPKALEDIQCAYTGDLIRGCLEHNIEKRLTIDQIAAHPFFQSQLPTEWPKIMLHNFDGSEMVTISIGFAENTDVQLYSFNITTDHSRYVAASLVRGEYITEAHLQDSAVQLHKIIEKVKRQMRIKNDLPEYYPISQPITVANTKTSKTSKRVELTLCNFDEDDHQIELELSQTRIGKVIKFQFGVMDHEAEEITENLIKEGHLLADNKAEFLTLLNGIVQRNRESIRSQQQDNEKMEDQNSHQVDGNFSETTEAHDLKSASDLSIEIRRKLSRENSMANQVISPDIGTRSTHSEANSTANPKSMTNGVDNMISPPIMTSRGIATAVPSTYYRPATNPIHPAQPNMVYYPPVPQHQYMMMPGGMPTPQIHPGQIPPQTNYVMMAPGHIPSNMYTNGHVPQHWSQHRGPMPGSVRGDMNAMRMTVSASHMSYLSDIGNRRDQDTPPPDSRLDT